MGLFLFIPNCTLASFQSVEINEINYIGYTNWKDNTPGSGDEFIELKNSNSNTPIILDGWTLRILSGSGDKTITLSGTITDYLVIRRITSAQSSLPPIDKVINITSTNFGSLNNTTGAYIEIRNASGITIDAVNFMGKWPAVTNNTQSLHKFNNLLWEVKPHSPLNIIPNPIITTPESEIVPAPEKISYGGVIISEIYPDPAEGLKEFVELYNTTDKDIDLNNWKLDDIPEGGSTIQTLSGIIPAKGFLLLEDSIGLKIGLNNGSDSVILYDPDGKIQSQVDYTDSKKGYSYMLIDNIWIWNAIPSPNSINIAPVSLPVEITPIEPKPIIPIIPQLPRYNIGSIIISEIYPYPSIGEEFIELYNNTEQDIDLTGWKISDLAKSFSLSGTIPAKGYKMYSQSETKISLNNSSETVTLTDNYNQIQSITSYTKAYKGLSYIPILQGWGWTQTITPNTQNIFTEKENADSSKSYTKIENIDSLLQTEDGEYIEIEGQVIIPVGTLIDNSFYIIKDNRVVKIYDRKKRFPTLKEGDIVKIQAEWHNTDTQQYIKTNSIDNIQIISGQKIDIQTQNITKLETSDWGKVVNIIGVLDTNTKTKLVLNNKNFETIIKLYSDKVTKPKMKKGDLVKLTGFTEVYDGEIRVIPWKVSQIKVIPAVKKFTTNSPQINKAVLDNNPANPISNVSKEYRGLDEYQIPVANSNFKNKAWYNKLWEIILNYKYFSTAIALNLIWWGYNGVLRYNKIITINSED